MPKHFNKMHNLRWNDHYDAHQHRSLLHQSSALHSGRSIVTVCCRSSSLFPSCSSSSSSSSSWSVSKIQFSVIYALFMWMNADGSQNIDLNGQPYTNIRKCRPCTANTLHCDHNVAAFSQNKIIIKGCMLLFTLKWIRANVPHRNKHQDRQIDRPTVRPINRPTGRSFGKRSHYDKALLLLYFSL